MIAWIQLISAMTLVVDKKSMVPGNIQLFQKILSLENHKKVSNY